MPFNIGLGNGADITTGVGLLPNLVSLRASSSRRFFLFAATFCSAAHSAFSSLFSSSKLAVRSSVSYSSTTTHPYSDRSAIRISFWQWEISSLPSVTSCCSRTTASFASSSRAAFARLDSASFSRSSNTLVERVLDLVCLLVKLERLLLQRFHLCRHLLLRLTLRRDCTSTCDWLMAARIRAT